MFFFLPRRDDQIHHHSVQLVLGDLIGVDVVGGVDRLRLDSVRCLTGLEVHNEDQRLCVVAMPSHTLEHFNFNRKENGRYFEKFIFISFKTHLEHVVEQMHCSTAHVDGDWVEEEDRIVLRHTFGQRFRFQIKR